MTDFVAMRIERPQGITDRTFSLIRDAIVNKVLPPGSRVTESALAKQLGVSKTPVRESLVRLRHIGLLEDDGKGLCVVMPSVDRIRWVFEFREALEANSARWASVRTDQEGIADLTAIAERSLDHARARDRDAFRASDRQFHLLVAHRSGNPFLERTVEEVLTVGAVLRQRDVPPGGNSVDCAMHHVEIADAISKHEAERAEEMMIEHIRTVRDLVVKRTAV